MALETLFSQESLHWKGVLHWWDDGELGISCQVEGKKDALNPTICFIKCHLKQWSAYLKDSQHLNIDLFLPHPKTQSPVQIG